MELKILVEVEVVLVEILTHTPQITEVLVVLVL
jgi:hypothetical protein